MPVSHVVLNVTPTKVYGGEERWKHEVAGAQLMLFGLRCAEVVKSMCCTPLLVIGRISFTGVPSFPSFDV